MKVEDLPKGIMIIEYPSAWAGQFSDRTFWCGTINGEVEDYHTKNTLINQAIGMGIEWAVIRNHKDGRRTIIKHSHNLNNTKEVENE